MSGCVRRKGGDSAVFLHVLIGRYILIGLMKQWLSYRPVAGRQERTNCGSQTVVSVSYLLELMLVLVNAVVGGVVITVIASCKI
jgi:hypothetical protein